MEQNRNKNSEVCAIEDNEVVCVMCGEMWPF